MTSREKAPQWLKWVLARTLPSSERSHILGDLDELYAHRFRHQGRARANRWYARQCAEFILAAVTMRRVSHRNRTRHGALAPATRAGVVDRVAGELRDAVRPVRRRPGYATAVMLTLSTGIAGVCAVYTLATWLLLRPVPGVEQPDGLATVLLEGPEHDGSWAMSDTDHRALRARASHVTDLAAASELDVHVTGLDERPLRLLAHVVTPNYLELLRVRPQAGRFFGEGTGEDAAEAGVVVLGDALARQYFGSAKAAPGARLTINGAIYTVTGVAPRGFRGHELPGDAGLWFPAAAAPALLHSPGTLGDPGRQIWSTTIARMRAGIAADELSTELTRALLQLQRENVAPFLGVRDLRLRAYEGIGLHPELRADVGRTLRILAAASLLLLVLACANVANLGLIQATATRGEVAMRRALGAGEGRIIRARLLEGAILGLGSAVLGIGLTTFALRAFSFGGIAGVADSLNGVRMEPRVVLFAAGVALFSGCAAALLPALASRRARLSGIPGAGGAGHRQGNRTREGLVVAQVALSAVLVVSAGLLGRTLMNLRSVDMGVSTAGVLSFTVDAGLQGYDGADLDALLARVVDTLEREPGVEAAGVVATPPFAGFRMPVALRPFGDPEGLVVARSLQVSAGTLDALGMRLIAGSPLTGEWLDSAVARTVVLNEQAVRVLFPGATPSEAIGRTVEMARGEARPARVVGVVADARLDNVRLDPEPLYVRPWAQGYRVGSFGVYVRTRSDVAALRARIPIIMRGLDPALPAYDVLTMEERIERLTVEQRFVAALGGTLSIVAVFLTMLGLYAALSQTVLERTREFGVRAALGARPGTLLRNIAARGATLTAAGMLIGLAVAATATRFLESRLFGVEHLDPLVYAGGALALLAAALAASLVPARRAATTDPAQTLRMD